MKRTTVAALATALILPLMMQSTNAQAKKDADWIDVIALKQDGINMDAIEVRPENGAFQDALDGS